MDNECERFCHRMDELLKMLVIGDDLSSFGVTQIRKVLHDECHTKQDAIHHHRSEQRAAHLGAAR